MKRTKKMLVGLLAGLSVLSGSFGLAACEKNYTASETDGLLAQLEQTISQNKSDLDEKIAEMQAAYEAKDSELLATIQANRQALDELKTTYKTELAILQAAYEAKDSELLATIQANRQALDELKNTYETELAILQAADKANEKAITDLTAEYEEKAKSMENAIAQANETISANKAALEKSIADLKAEYDQNFDELNDLIAILQTTDTTQAEKIAELVNKITALEQATRITDVKFEENGDLTITFGDGTTKTVETPDKHVHTFGDWTVFTAEETPCENRLFFRVCTECNGVEWKQGSYADHDFTTVTTEPTCQAGGYDTKTCEICGKVETINPTPIADHAWATEYSFDNSYHWIDCDTCDEFKNKEEHTVLSSGECSVCNELVGATEGIVYDVSNGEAQVVMYEGTATRVRIADTYQGAPVTKIGNEVFKSSNVISVVIPNSVISIGDSAFYDCDSLTNVVIGDSVTSIGNDAFQNCGSLTSVTIGESVTSIGSNAFWGCQSLTSVTIGENVTSIGSNAFGVCSSLTSIEIPDSVVSIGNDAFWGCNNLQFNEYGNAKYLGSKTNDYFALIELKSKNFSSYTIHNNTKIIASSVFQDCSNLTSIEIPDSVTSISYMAFYDCSSLTSVVIGDGVTSIGDRAFSGCSSLTSVIFKDVSTWYMVYNYTDWQNKTGGMQMDVGDPSVNAVSVQSYSIDYWYKL